MANFTQGYFALGPAARGAADLTASSPEHVLLATPISIPHRGELTAVSIRLAGRRAITFAALREVASHLSPTSDASAALTQRELLDLLRARGASPPLLPRLVGVVESACYGRSPPTDVEMAEVRTIATAIVLASAKSPPPAGSQRSPRTER